MAFLDETGLAELWALIKGVAVNKAGDTMTGELKIQNTSEHYALRKWRTVNGKNYFISAGLGSEDNVGSFVMQVYNETDQPNSYKARLTFNEVGIRYHNILQENVSGGSYDVLTTKNKPFGSYTGNGSATERTIKTGGRYHTIAIWSQNGMGIVTPQGFINSGSFIDGATIRCADGVLTLATTNNKANASGVTYWYQVL